MSLDKEPEETITIKRPGRKKGQELELLRLSDGGQSGRCYVKKKDLGSLWNFYGEIKETLDESSGDSDYSIFLSHFSEHKDDVREWDEENNLCVLDMVTTLFFL